MKACDKTEKGSYVRDSGSDNTLPMQGTSLSLKSETKGYQLGLEKT